MSTAFAGQMELLDEDLRVYLESCPFGTAERCLLTARLFGDESELTFWTVALHYIRAARSGAASGSVEIWYLAVFKVWRNAIPQLL